MGSGRDSDDSSRGHGRSSSRKKHKKHRHRRSRSRSRGSTIHVNPAFGYQKPSPPAPSYSGGGMASQLLEANRFLESDISRVKQELLIAQNNLQIAHHNNSMMVAEIRSLSNQKLNIERRCNEISGERRKWVESTCELNAKISSLNSMASSLRAECCEGRKKLEEKDEIIKGWEYQNDMIRQQIGALNDRNAGLKAKCEELVITNRHKQDEINNGKSFVESARIDMKKMEADVQCANLEIQRLVKELETSSEREMMWKKEKTTLEKSLGKKDDEIRLLKFNTTKSLNEMTEKLKKSENRLKTEKPALQSEFATEAIYRVLETVKNTYSMQLNRLEAEVETLKKEQEEKEEKIEELPDYLQTPRKPDPSKMNTIHRTPQAVIPSTKRPSALFSNISPNSDIPRPARTMSGPPVDSPSQWNSLRSIMETEFETNGSRAEENGSTEHVSHGDMHGNPQELINEQRDENIDEIAQNNDLDAVNPGTFEVSLEEVSETIIVSPKVEIEREEQEISQDVEQNKEDDETPPEKRIKVETLEVTSDEVFNQKPSTSQEGWFESVKNEVFDISEDDLLGDVGNGDIGNESIENIELIERQIFGDE